MQDIYRYSNRRYRFNPPPKKPKSKSGFLVFFLFLLVILIMVRFFTYRDNDAQPVDSVQASPTPAEEEKPKIEPLKAQAVDNPEYEPVRDEDMPDLAIPTAHAFSVVDADTGQILAGNHEDDQRQIASLTKMMTAILVMEKIKDLDKPIDIDEEAVYVEGTRIGCPRSGYCITPRLKVGEQVSARNLLKAMLMNSANDAAIALAKDISGSQEKFAGLMNEKAGQMELANTHFCTPSGLEIDGRESECYSSAADIARIAAYSMRYEEIWKMFRIPNNTDIYSCDSRQSHTLINSDILLDEIPNCLGGKTGFTPAAGYSLLMGVSDPTHVHRVIIVLLDDPYRWQDIRAAISWVFEAYSWEKKKK
ncbi:MAG: serine hydrolase [Candidatus Moranbacteria bacterium]|nr:serine hydrolase [Candidatus Moranbacteria bacterium]